MVWVYILYSAKLERYYVGITRQLRKRQAQHLRGESHWTKQAGDWVLVYRQGVEDYSRARELEKRIKARGAGRFLEQLPNSAEAEQG